MNSSPRLILESIQASRLELIFVNKEQEPTKIMDMAADQSENGKELEISKNTRTLLGTEKIVEKEDYNHAQTIRHICNHVKNTRIKIK